jgi:lipopolysaccharide transport system permease protein
MAQPLTKWQWEIRPQTTWLGVGWKELYFYKDLLLQLVRKEFLASYQQTLLGPFWIILQPLLTVLTYVLIFYKVFSISTQGVPAFLYYLTGVTLWSLFSDIFLTTSQTFTKNMHVFSKVYFPRIIAPLSSMLLHGLRFSIQLLLLALVLLTYFFAGKAIITPLHLFLIIPAIVVTAGIAFGSGLIFSILTAKYKDLNGMLQLITRLLLFVCPVFYSMEIVPEKVRWIVEANPLSCQFEVFRYALLGQGQYTGIQFLYSCSFMLFLLLTGTLLFNKKGDKLIDVV